MNFRIDEKGKYYTQHVSKDMLPAFVRTSEQVIVGNIHTRPESRLKDELNEDKSRFLAVTDARVYDAHSEQLLYHTALMLVSYAHVVLICPLDAHEPIRELPWVATS